MNPSAIVILAHGFEDIEAITPIDILRRAGVEVTVASREDDLRVESKHGLPVCADKPLVDAFGRDYDAVILPGGPGHARLREDERIIIEVQRQFDAGRWVAAICAAPLVLHEAGILSGIRYTAHFTAAEELTGIDEAAEVVIDQNVITSRGAGTAVAFGLAITEKLTDRATAQKVAESIHYFPELPDFAGS